LELTAILFLAVVVLLASMLQGAIGFGFGLLAVALLSLVRPLKESTPLVALLNAPVVFYVYWQLRRSVVWSRLTPVLIGALIGIPIGVFALTRWPNDILVRILGVVTMAAAVRTLLKRDLGEEDPDAAPCRPRDRLAGVGIGLASGVLGGAYNAGGPPVISWVYSCPWTKEQRTATIQAIFCVSIIARIIFMAASGLYHPQLLVAAGICMPGAILGGVYGHHLFNRFSRRKLEITVCIVLLILGLRMTFWAH
jgi:uncharacterized membrane protein YfcA